MQQVQYEVINQAQQITTLRGRALDWYIIFSIVPIGATQKTLDQIRVGMIDEFSKLKSESQCIIEIKESKHLPT